MNVARKAGVHDRNFGRSASGRHIPVAARKWYLWIRVVPEQVLRGLGRTIQSGMSMADLGGEKSEGVEWNAAQVCGDVEVVNPGLVEGWDAQMECLGEATPFHSSAWAAVLNETYGFEPAYFACRREGRPVLVMPMMKVVSSLTGRRLVSLPFSDCCDPISEREMDIAPLMKLVIGHARSQGCKYVEWRSRRALFPNEPVWNTYYGHSLVLDGNEDAVSGGFSSNTRRNIRKAERENVLVQFGEDLKSVKEFYRLHCQTRKEHGLPPQPFNFFRKIWEHVIRLKRGIVILARHQDKCIGGAVFFHFSNRALCKFAASDKRYQAVRANNLIMWEAIKWYGRKSFVSFDFGRTDLSGEGLRRFKLGWGCVEFPIFYYRFDLSRNRFLAGTDRELPFSSLVRRMPVFLLRQMGRVIYKHFA